MTEGVPIRRPRAERRGTDSGVGRIALQRPGRPLLAWTAYPPDPPDVAAERDAPDPAGGALSRPTAPTVARDPPPPIARATAGRYGHEGTGGACTSALTVAGPGRLRCGPVPSDPPAFDGLRFLVVDDTEELAEILTFVLAREGADVEVATDGHQAVARATQEPFDVVLMDVGLPGIDGLEACRRITAERDVLVVMLSARDSAADRAAGAEAGAAGYLSKPFAPRALVEQLRALLAATDRSGRDGG